MDETRDRRAEGSLLVASDPDEVPVWALEASRKSSADASASADAHAALVERRSIRDTSELEFSCPECSRRVVDEAASEVALHTADHVVILRVLALGDDTECVVLHDARAADTAEEALLHAAVKSNDGNLRRWQLDVDGDFADADPRDKNTDETGLINYALIRGRLDSQNRHSHNEPEILLVSNVNTIRLPSARDGVVAVAEDDEDPSEDNADPTDETMMALEDTKQR